jgi:hypothetical protein
MLYLIATLTNPWAAKWHGGRRTAYTAWKLRLIRTAAMFDAIWEAGVYWHAAKMEIRFTGVTKWPAANALIQIEQRGFIRHFWAWLCGHKAAWRGRWDGRLLIAGALTHEAAGAN